MALGFTVVGVGLWFFQGTERSRERRHAYRPSTIAEPLLELAHLSSRDVLYDLECGDGTVVVSAARQHGIRGWCFDIYPQRLADARERALSAGVESLITFQQRNWDAVDVSPASVVILWMIAPTGHADYYKLRSQLTRELRPGSRIVSYRRELGDWQRVSIVPMASEPHEPPSVLRLWVIDGIVRP